MTTRPMDEPVVRAAVVAAAQALAPRGLTTGTSGNVSARCARDGVAGFVITPSAMPYDAMTPETLAWVALDQPATDDETPLAPPARWIGPHTPSTEWRMHRDVLAHRPAVHAVIHAHAPAATALACLPDVQRDGIPAFHYMVAVAGGDNIRCAPYATFGTAALSAYAVAALEGRTACLLAHHGILALGATPDAALAVAVEVETLAQMYVQARAAGTPAVLDAEEMARVQERFTRYQRPVKD
jgi:L-fuculose-phosphate aldolase